MRRLTLLTALSLVLAACDGGASGGATGGVGGKAVGGAAGGGASGKAGAGGGAGNGPGGAGTGGMAVGGASGGGVSGSSGNGGGAGAGGGGASGSAGNGGSAAGHGGSAGSSGSAAGNGGSAGGSGGGAAGAGGVSVGGAAGGGASGASGAAGLGGAAGPQPLDGGGTMQAVPLSTNDLVFDSTRGVLYASTNSTANGVVTVEPASGTVTQALPVGGLPSVLAISDDCSALYVGVSTPAAPPKADSVRRIDLASMTAGPLVSLGMADTAKLGAGEIAAVPGSSTQYVVSRRRGGTPDFAGLALYDGSTKLAEVDSFFGSGSSIAFIDRSTLVGCSNTQSPSELIRYSVTSTAITPGTYVKNVIAGASRTRIAFGSGWIFASDGHAVNAATLQPLGRYGDGLIPYSSSTAPSPDSDGKSVWFLSYVVGTGWAVLEFDRTTFQLRRTISLGSLAGDFGVSNATRLVRWSPTGFAFGTYDKLYLINLPN